MHYTEHARISARKFGGVPEDYVQLHKLMDSSKHYLPHFTHRIFSHNTWFVQVLDDLLGPLIENSDGDKVSVRDILHAHLREDHNGTCPTLQNWAENFKLTETHARWVNQPDPKEIAWLRKTTTTQEP